MDYFGPMKTGSISGKEYTLVIVDEFTRYTWILFLRFKADSATVIVSLSRELSLNISKKFVNS